MKKAGFTVTFILISIFYFFQISSCAMPTISRFAADSNEVEEIFRTTSSISLAWNYDEPANVQIYKMYYRHHGTTDWIFLDSVDSSAPIFEVSHDTLGDGSWDFGVTAIDLSGTESDIHSSLDSSAVPSTGWYLLWAE